MQRQLPKLLAICLVLTLLVPLLLVAPGAALADQPTGAEVDEDLLTPHALASPDEVVSVHLRLAGDPVFTTYMDKRGASKAEAAAAQKARKDALKNQQAG